MGALILFDATVFLLKLLVTWISWYSDLAVYAMIHKSKIWWCTWWIQYRTPNLFSVIALTSPYKRTHGRGSLPKDISRTKSERKRLIHRTLWNPPLVRMIQFLIANEANSWKYEVEIKLLFVWNFNVFLINLYFMKSEIIHSKSCHNYLHPITRAFQCQKCEKHAKESISVT